MISSAMFVASSSKGGSVHVRKAVQKDGPALLSLIRALADYEKLPPPDDSAQHRLLADAFSDRPRFEAILAEVKEDAAAESAPIAAGYAIIFETYSSFLARPTLYLEDIFVLEKYRKQRIGYALFQFCVREAHQRGCGRMEWTVLDWNKPSIEFYERQGAKRLAEWLPYRLTADQIEAMAHNDDGRK
jgi:GNAT superfamily N-acetyltransferase